MKSFSGTSVLPGPNLVSICSAHRPNLASSLAVEGCLAICIFSWDPDILTQPHLDYGLIPKGSDPNS